MRGGAHRLRIPVRVRLLPAGAGAIGAPHRTARGNALLYARASSGKKLRLNVGCRRAVRSHWPPTPLAAHSARGALGR